MKILLLTRYSIRGASSRLRFLQYLPYLKENNFDISVYPLLNDIYLDRLYAGRRPPILNIVLCYIRRFYILLWSPKYDLLYIEKEIFPGLPSWAEQFLAYFKIPYVVDFDDAIFHNYDLNTSKIVRFLLGKKIKTVIYHSVLIIAGNKYIARYAKESHAKHIEIIPTVIDLNKYLIKKRYRQKIFTIGWIGSPSSAKFLNIVKPIISQFCREVSAKMMLIGSGPIDLDDIPLEILEWSELTEVDDIHSFDVGIMPLSNEPWEQGKCGYKLIQYMACGIPVISSPIGINREIVDEGINGFLASSNDEWMSALRILYHEPDLCIKFGESGRKKVESEYSLQVTSPLICKLLRDSLSQNSVMTKHVEKTIQDI